MPQQQPTNQPTDTHTQHDKGSQQEKQEQTTTRSHSFQLLTFTNIIIIIIHHLPNHLLPPFPLQTKQNKTTGRGQQQKGQERERERQ